MKVLTNGLGQLSEAQISAIDGSKKAEDGTKSLQTGIQQAHQGISTIVEKMDEVIAGASKLNEGSNQVTLDLSSFKMERVQLIKARQTLRMDWPSCKLN